MCWEEVAVQGGSAVALFPSNLSGEIWEHSPGHVVQPGLQRLSGSCRRVKPRGGPMAWQRGLAFHDHKSTERAQLRPGIEMENLLESHVILWVGVE